ncbi:MAG: pyruvate dehydrogenase (acetyl-transferring) E1 component subunit alpha [Deltaproteobacteria bacterium]|jgi:pyruvate dehydrogenase E1 component alpha subunit|nr:pyruvate dehydrogenase (acetyl-transferring) E1 component subunit alpha [Deltaproteobacteria bacterium]MBT4262659.1 pyruvate dehydrogenase (acetyl-transferring) E1 component subunit alpha [Deltaproteobacteria bacterium]MBT4643204.1 pyruvate dehydrogenase (acetyl-transferring) E1 component subunit alpha [Deltaproteobacteria bacterium]MBT6502735.1 pyruvate dehydrogenase (acetyl-transferring) E1 component subunit alpha [Deltaproteobacteria bacterium]MBT7152785.1 pyruvate dehydrogenase (acetyl-t
MPRKNINISDKIETLSILDEHGKLDEDLEPDIPEDELIKLLRGMLLGRKFDERMLNLQRQGRIGTFAPISGQEAAQIGAIALLRSSDWMVPAFRETAAEIWRGRSLESVIIYNSGYCEGAQIPENLNNLPISVPVGSQILHAVGLGWAMKYRKVDDVVMTIFGDGATSEGDFHEALNFAGVFQTPVIFVCQNNQWAISIPVHKQTRSKTLVQKALAYGLPGIQVDGNDVLAVYVAAQEAVARARAGGGPTLIECVTYRMTMHTTADDPTRYRSDEEVEMWRKRDPIERFQKYLLSRGTLSRDKLEGLEAEILTQIQTAIDQAEAEMTSLGDPVDMFDHSYEQMPAYLMEQKKAFLAELDESREEADNG